MNEVKQAVSPENISVSTVNPVLVNRQYILQQNPFLVGDDLDDPALDIKSVDEFTIARKGERIPLYLFLSLTDVRRGKKRKLIKRNFKIWKKEYLAKEKEFTQKVRNQKTATKDKRVKKFPFVTWLIYLFAFLQSWSCSSISPCFRRKLPAYTAFCFGCGKLLLLFTAKSF